MVTSPIVVMICGGVTVVLSFDVVRAEVSTDFVVVVIDDLAFDIVGGCSLVNKHKRHKKSVAEQQRIVTCEPYLLYIHLVLRYEKTLKISSLRSSLS